MPSPPNTFIVCVATGVPMGIEMLPVANHHRGGIKVTGRTLEEALNILIGIDPRYEWRELNGVVVVRPTGAWTAGKGLLSMPTPAIRFDGRAGTAQAIVQSLAGVTPPSEPVSDSKTFRVDLAPATLFDLLNATILAHGEMTWAVEETDEVQQRVGFRHVIWLRSFTGPTSGAPVRW
jgi:hypothetical protein